MATGISYTDETILAENICDVSSIVRYRGGFNWHAYAIERFYAYTFFPFTPVWVNFTTREVFPWVGAWTNTVKPTDDTNVNYISWAFLYNQTEIAQQDEKSSVTLIMKADGIRLTGLNALRYKYNQRKDYYGSFTVYAKLLTTKTDRESLYANYPKCSFILD